MDIWCTLAWWKHDTAPPNDRFALDLFDRRGQIRNIEKLEVLGRSGAQLQVGGSFGSGLCFSRPSGAQAVRRARLCSKLKVRSMTWGHTEGGLISSYRPCSQQLYSKKNLAIYQSVTFQFWNFSNFFDSIRIGIEKIRYQKNIGFSKNKFRIWKVSDSVTKKVCIEKSIGFGITNIWYKKSLRIGIKKFK